MSVLKRLESIRVGIELPFWDGVKWWARTRPKPLVLPRLPERLRSDEAIAWFMRRPKVGKR